MIKHHAVIIDLALDWDAMQQQCLLYLHLFFSGDIWVHDQRTVVAWVFSKSFSVLSFFYMIVGKSVGCFVLPDE